MNVITKFGGLIITTIGVQLAFDGIKIFLRLAFRIKHLSDQTGRASGDWSMLFITNHNG